MGEKEFPLFLKDPFPLPIFDPKGYISQGKPLHRGTVLCLQRNKRALWRLYRMPHGPCHSISVSGRAGSRIGDSPSRKDYRFTWMAIPALAFHCSYYIFFYHKTFRPFLHNIHPSLSKGVEQPIDHIGSLV